MSQAPIYQPPEWSTAPQSNVWCLSVLKGGVELEKLPLDAAFTIVGKQPGVCGIVLDHGECSYFTTRLVDFMLIPCFLLCLRFCSEH